MLFLLKFMVILTVQKIQVRSQSSQGIAFTYKLNKKMIKFKIYSLTLKRTLVSNSGLS